jgi:hypothetical protein
MPVEHRDFYKFNKELFDDDYNHGQAWIVKAKQPSPCGQQVTVKVSDPSASGESSMGIEYKVNDLSFWGTTWNGLCDHGKGVNGQKMTMDASKVTGCEGLTWMPFDWKVTMTKNQTAVSNHSILSGFIYNHGDLYFKMAADLIDRGNIQSEAVFNCCDKWSFSKNQSYTVGKGFHSLELGAAFSPSEHSKVAFKYNTNTASLMSLGKMVFMFHQKVQARKFGFEFSYDHVKKTQSSRLAMSEEFSKETSGKVKFHENGDLNALVKHKLCNWLTISATSGMKLKNFDLQKTAPTPFGFQFDFKM